MSARLRLRISVVVEADGDGYHAYCPAFEGLHAAGDSEDAAVEGARAAALAYLESMVAHGDPYRWDPIARSQGRARACPSRRRPC